MKTTIDFDRIQSISFRQKHIVVFRFLPTMANFAELAKTYLLVKRSEPFQQEEFTMRDVQLPETRILAICPTL